MSAGPALAGLRVDPGAPPRLDRRDPAARPFAESKAQGQSRLDELVARLGLLHNRLLAEAERSLLLILQGMDAAGKDGTIRHVLTGVNPQGCRVVSFRQPTVTELGHDYLWRVHAVCPARGELAIFNRSHYEDVVAVRVRGLAPRRAWERRFGHIRAFEQMLADEGTAVVKVFLHVSPETQRQRLQDRLDDPEKRWKFRQSDLDDRRHWDEYAAAYEQAIEQTSTDSAPWYVVPADHNWSRNLAVGELLVDVLERLDPRLPAAQPGLQGITIA